ncbi:hypothetical protein FB451DRAFT_1391964 [Mycena latifolia]|nr:hypothetical protein FB451DRAFT_1391964 [Mycena latifolia]
MRHVRDQLATIHDPSCDAGAAGPPVVLAHLWIAHASSPPSSGSALAWLRPLPPSLESGLRLTYRKTMSKSADYAMAWLFGTPRVAALFTRTQRVDIPAVAHHPGAAPESRPPRSRASHLPRKVPAGSRSERAGYPDIHLVCKLLFPAYIRRVLHRRSACPLVVSTPDGLILVIFPANASASTAPHSMASRRWNISHTPRPSHRVHTSAPSHGDSI